MLGSCSVTRAQGTGCTDEAVHTIIGNTKKVCASPKGSSCEALCDKIRSGKLQLDQRKYYWTGVV